MHGVCESIYGVCEPVQDVFAGFTLPLMSCRVPCFRRGRRMDDIKPITDYIVNHDIKIYNLTKEKMEATCQMS
jgi:hypothetical protein